MGLQGIPQSYSFIYNKKISVPACFYSLLKLYSLLKSSLQTMKKCLTSRQSKASMEFQKTFLRVPNRFFAREASSSLGFLGIWLILKPGSGIWEWKGDEIRDWNCERDTGIGNFTSRDSGIDKSTEIQESRWQKITKRIKLWNFKRPRSLTKQELSLFSCQSLGIFPTLLLYCDLV